MNACGEHNGSVEELMRGSEKVELSRKSTLGHFSLLRIVSEAKISFELGVSPRRMRHQGCKLPLAAAPI